jgi:glycosyltransferase involved in cell wall biosynthesis
MKRLIVKITQPCLLKSATHFFAASKAAAQFSFGKHYHSYTVLPNPIDIKSFIYNDETRNRVKGQLGVSDYFVVGNVGRFTSEKNHVYLFEIMKAVQNKQPNVVLLLVGYGPLLENMKLTVKKMNINTLFLGMRDDISELMQAMDIFVFPSLYEGLGTAVVEAQASGLPCIVSDRLPSECRLIPDLVTYLPIAKSSINEWVNVILRELQYKRINTYGDICTTGFNVSVQALWEHEFYMMAGSKLSMDN